MLLTILGMLGVTYLPRVLPIWTLSTKELPPVVTRWLGYVPTAVLSALLAPVLLTQQGHLALDADNLFLLAAFPTFLVAWRTKSFFGTVAVGMGLIAFIRHIQ